VHTGTYGARRVHAELRLGRNIRVGRKRVERLMRRHRLQGVHRRRLRGCTRRDAAAEPAEDPLPGAGRQQERRARGRRPDHAINRAGQASFTHRKRTGTSSCCQHQSTKYVLISVSIH
jgi:transposase InsO family protein